jgi:circadian clock protein KaiB
VRENTSDIWKLQLYVAGYTPRSANVFTNIKKICEDYLAGKCQIDVIDLLKNPKLAQRDQILATPTLVRIYPLPMRKLVGDLSDTARVLKRLDIAPLEN